MKSNWFVAWSVRGLRDWLEAAGRNAPGGLRFFHHDDLHITLAFLGAYQESLMPALAAMLKGIAFPQIEATFSHLVALPQERRFAAISYELLRGKQDLITLIEKWRDPICRQAGAKIEMRPALPHMTIARPQRKATRHERTEILRWMAAVAPPAEPVLLSRPVVYTWSTDRAQRQFRILE